MTTDRKAADYRKISGNNRNEINPANFPRSNQITLQHSLIYSEDSGMIGFNA